MTNKLETTKTPKTVSEHEEQLALTLKENGTLEPLLNALIEQVAAQAKEQPKTSDSSSHNDSPVRAILRKTFPDASEAELDKLGRAY